MNIIMKNTSEIYPYSNNAKKHDETQINNVAESIKQYGFVQPIVIDKENVIVIGHCRYAAANKLGIAEIPCVCVDDLTEEQVKALRIVDNKSNESPWDIDVLKDELEEIDLSIFDFDFDFKNLDNSNIEIIDEEDFESEEESPYTMNVNAPVYEIKGEYPKLCELFDDSKTKYLIEKIKKAHIDSEIKKFLTYAAQRHLKFNYSKIAEFYAHADKEVQELFEDSALVIIDFQSAIKNGFTKLSKRIEEMRNEE